METEELTAEETTDLGLSRLDDGKPITISVKG